MVERFSDARGPNHGIKEFVGVLILFGSHSPKEVIEAVDAVINAVVSSKAAVEHLLHRANGTGHDIFPTPLGAWPTLPRPDVSVSSRVGGVQ